MAATDRDRPSSSTLQRSFKLYYCQDAVRCYRVQGPVRTPSVLLQEESQTVDEKVGRLILTRGGLQTRSLRWLFLLGVDLSGRFRAGAVVDVSFFTS